MEITVRHNQSEDGIEIEFSEKPEADVRSLLKEHRFRWHRRDGYWYAKHSEERMKFALSLSDSDEVEKVGTAPTKPSFESTRENLEARLYSYVSIRFNDLGDELDREEFVIFEPRQSMAKSMAVQFGKLRHGPDYRSVGIYPKNYIRESRELFEAGRIIREEDLTIGGETVPSDSEPALDSEIPASIPAEPTSEIPVESDPGEPVLPPDLEPLNSDLEEIKAGIFSLLSELFGELDGDSKTLFSTDGNWELERLASWPVGKLALLRPAGHSNQIQPGALSMEISIDSANQSAQLESWAKAEFVGFFVTKFTNDRTVKPVEVFEWNQKLFANLKKITPESGGEKSSEQEPETVTPRILASPSVPELEPISPPRSDLDEAKPEEEKLSKRVLLNRQIEELVKKKDSEGSPWMAEDRELIAGYTGSGGLAKDGMEERGTLYEFYTPDDLARQMWGLANQYGYNGGPVLEPACGTGIFLGYAPTGAELTGYETNPISARIAQILHPRARIYNKAFESIFFAGNVHLGDNFNSPRYELVIGNPPCGPFSGRYAELGEKRHTKARRYEEYFTRRGLDLLLPGGLLVFVLPSSWLSGAPSKFKDQLALKIGEFSDAYRLPVRSFKHTSIGTDIIVIRKK